MFLYESTAFRNETKCIYPTTTTETSTEASTESTTTVTTTSTAVSTTRASLSMNATSEMFTPPPNVYRICVSSCPVGYYGNESYKCVRCNSLSLNCTNVGNTTDVCACKYGDNSNGTYLSKKEDTEGGVDERIIIGVGAVGGVLVAVIIVVVCCCCRRKKDQGKTRMSVLLEVSVFTTYIGVIWYRGS